jgi:hypothetical protein
MNLKLADKTPSSRGVDELLWMVEAHAQSKE